MSPFDTALCVANSVVDPFLTFPLYTKPSMSFNFPQNDTETQIYMDNDISLLGAQSPNKARKRHKVATSCNRCRQNKRKCDSGVPCSNCKRVGAECLYTDAQHSRALWGDALLSPEKVMGVSSSPSTTPRSSAQASSPTLSPISSGSSSPVSLPPSSPDHGRRLRRDRSYSFSAGSNRLASGFHPFHPHYNRHHQQQRPVSDKHPWLARSQSMIEPSSPMALKQHISPSLPMDDGLVQRTAMSPNLSAHPMMSSWSSLSDMTVLNPRISTQSPASITVPSSTEEQQLTLKTLSSSPPSSGIGYFETAANMKTEDATTLVSASSPQGITNIPAMPSSLTYNDTPGFHITESKAMPTAFTSASVASAILAESPAITRQSYTTGVDSASLSVGDGAHCGHNPMVTSTTTAITAATIITTDMTTLDGDLSPLESLLWHDMNFLPSEIVSMASPFQDNAGSWSTMYAMSPPQFSLPSPSMEQIGSFLR